MARVTVEDCVEKVVNRFELVVLASERAKKINSGSQIFVERDNDKDVVVALREIAAGLTSTDSLRESLITSLQKLDKIDKMESEYDSELAEDFDYIADGSDFLIDEESSLDEEGSGEMEAFEDVVNEDDL